MRVSPLLACNETVSMHNFNQNLSYRARACHEVDKNSNPSAGTVILVLRRSLWIFGVCRLLCMHTFGPVFSKSRQRGIAAPSRHSHAGQCFLCDEEPFLSAVS